MLPAAVRVLYIIHFIAHIPVTCIIDAQVVLNHLYPNVSLLIALCCCALHRLPGSTPLSHMSGTASTHLGCSRLASAKSWT
eukprot:4461-Heterococcus_DN1.PRE.3